MKIRFLLLFIMVGFTAAPANSLSLPVQKKAGKSTKGSVETSDKEKEKGEKIFLGRIEILGKIEKPQTVFILPGKDPNIDDIQVDRSFFKEIFRPVEFDKLNVDKELVDSIKKVE